MKKLIFLLIAVVALASLTLAACGQATPTTTTATTSAATTTAVKTTTAATTTTTAAKTTPAADAAKYGGTYKRALNSSPTRPVGYPAEAANDSFTWACPALDRLVRVDRMGTFIPDLAVSWTPAADGKSLTLGLRKGVKFHDGSDFNASVAKWNLDLQIAAKTTNEWQSIDVVDDYTIRINVAQYKNTMLNTLAGGITQMISKVSFDKNGLDGTRWNPVGTGPFIFVSYEKDVRMTFKRNPNYWDTGKPYIDGLVVSVIPDATVRKLAFIKGDTQRTTASGLDAQEMQKSGYEMISEPAGTYTLIPDSKTSTSPWSNVNVRAAASYSLDRESLAKALGYGYCQAAYQVYPSFTQTAIPGLIKQAYSTSKAKDLLTQAGYPNGFKTSIHPFSVIPTDYTTAVASMLNAVGIVVDIDKATSAKYTDLRYNGWDGLMNHGLNSYTNFAMMSDYFLQTQFPSVKLSPGFKEGLTAAALTPKIDPTLIQAVVKIMYDDVMVIPYIEENRMVFLQKGVHDPCTLTYSTNDYIDKEVWLDPSAR
jgi:ABC-type transport system substrate-binding protein